MRSIYRHKTSYSLHSHHVQTCLPPAPPLIYWTFKHLAHSIHVLSNFCHHSRFLWWESNTWHLTPGCHLRFHFPPFHLLSRSFHSTCHHQKYFLLWSHEIKHLVLNHNLLSSELPKQPSATIIKMHKDVIVALIFSILYRSSVYSSLLPSLKSISQNYNYPTINSLIYLVKASDSKNHLKILFFNYNKFKKSISYTPQWFSSHFILTKGEHLISQIQKPIFFRTSHHFSPPVSSFPLPVTVQSLMSHAGISSPC